MNKRCRDTVNGERRDATENPPAMAKAGRPVGDWHLVKGGRQVPCLLQVNAWTIRAAEGAQGSRL
jgi:hypothetical protein